MGTLAPRFCRGDGSLERIMQVQIPIVNKEIDTSDGGDGIVRPFAGAVAGFVGLFGAVGVASWVINSFTSATGTETPDVPGV